MVKFSVGFFSVALASASAAASPVFAQAVAPAAVTPSTLAPVQRQDGVTVEIPDVGAIAPPAGSQGLNITLGSVIVDGGFPEVSTQTDAIIARLQGRRVSLAEIYAAASGIEAAHARAGYVLARVSVPPQNLSDGGGLRIVVTDGFIEAVDVSALPSRVRSAVAARVHGLEGRRHVTLADIEQTLLLAGDVPGLSLRSTLKRGARPGGADIVLEGERALVSGSLSADNSLDRSLGRWGLTAQVALNDAFGLGEQIYGFAAADANPGHWFDDHAKERVLGAGAIVPFGDGRLTLNPEYTYSRTAPSASLGAPPSEGVLKRFALRAGYTLARTRARSLVLSASLEQLSETNALRDFDVEISHDRYMALRGGLSASGVSASGATYGLAAQVSQGLGDTGGRSAADAVSSGVPYSRLGADNSFTKLTLQAHGDVRLAGPVHLSASAKAQSTFSNPVLRAEQFSLEGADALSAYTGGETAVDEGAAARLELRALTGLGDGKGGAALAPYVFAAVGSGRINRPTALETSSFTAESFGVGARLSLPRANWSLSVEYARGVSDYAALDGQDRVNVATTIVF